MATAKVDPIQDARAKMLSAADLYARATRQLRAAIRTLEGTPEFKATKRLRAAGRSAGESVTPAWWLHNCCLSTLHDITAEDLARLLRLDAINPEGGMREFIEDEERCLGRRVA